MNVYPTISVTARGGQHGSVTRFTNTLGVVPTYHPILSCRAGDQNTVRNVISFFHRCYHVPFYALCVTASADGKRWNVCSTEINPFVANLYTGVWREHTRHLKSTRPSHARLGV